jgi:hypothetical protein
MGGIIMGLIDTAYSSSEGPWTCARCGYAGTLRVVAEAVKVNKVVTTLVATVAGAVQPGAQREADRRARVARQLAKCPGCGRRAFWPHALLVAQVVTIGVIVGLVGAFAAPIAAMMIGTSLKLDLPLFPSMLVGYALATLAVGLITYRRRVEDLNRWANFLRPDPE